MIKRLTDSSLPDANVEDGMTGSTLSAIVVCSLIGFLILVVIIIIVVLLMRRRWKRQKDAEAAAQQTVVGPSTKPAQPTHNGTWSSTFRGLWKDQTWQEAQEDDETPVRFVLLISECFLLLIIIVCL